MVNLLDLVISFHLERRFWNFGYRFYNNH